MFVIRYRFGLVFFKDEEFTEVKHLFTPDDTGTGIAYKGLVVYDLAVLGLTRLPVLVHDSVVLKQISGISLTSGLFSMMTRALSASL